MKTIKSQLFPESESWLSQAFNSAEAAFIVEDYFARYLKQKPKKTYQGNLYLELIDVEFCAPEDVPRVLIKIGYSSNTLHVLVPDKNYSEEEKENIRNSYQIKYAPTLKESHFRTNVLLWRTFSEDEQKRILAGLED